MWVLQWGALGCVAVAALVARDRRLAGWFGAKAVAILVIFVAYNVWLRSLQMADQEESYGKSFSLGVLHLTGGLREYGRNYWKLYGPLAVGVVAILAWVIPDLWREKPGDRKTTFLILAFGLGFMASAIAIYIPWNSRLYRYMLTGVFGFNLVGGILLACMFEWLGQAWREQRWILLLIPVGVAVTLLPPLVLLLIAMVAAGLMLAQHYQALGAALATGMFASGFVYMLACTPALRKAVDQTYMNRERAGWDAAMFVMRQNARGHYVGYAGNRSNELIGSLTGHIWRRGIDSKMVSATDEEMSQANAMVLVHVDNSPPDEVARATAGRRVMREYGKVEGDIAVPVSFWAFRDRLWQRGVQAKHVDYRSLDYVWRFYE